MLTAAQKDLFDAQGYLVVENVFAQDTILKAVRIEYCELLNQLIAGWIDQGLIPKKVRDLDFFYPACGML